MSAAEKIDVSLDAEELEWVIKRAHKTSASAADVLREALRKERQREARMELVSELGGDSVTPKDLLAVFAEWRAESP